MNAISIDILQFSSLASMSAPRPRKYHAITGSKSFIKDVMCSGGQIFRLASICGTSFKKATHHRHLTRWDRIISDEPTTPLTSVFAFSSVFTASTHPLFAAMWRGGYWASMTVLISAPSESKLSWYPRDSLKLPCTLAFNAIYSGLLRESACRPRIRHFC